MGAKVTTMSLTNFIPDQLMAELQAAADRATAGVHDPEAMRQAAERMEQRREEIRQQFGVQEIGVNILRELRGYPVDAGNTFLMLRPPFRPSFRNP